MLRGEGHSLLGDGGETAFIGIVVMVLMLSFNTNGTK